MRLISILLSLILSIYYVNGAWIATRAYPKSYCLVRRTYVGRINGFNNCAARCKSRVRDAGFILVGWRNYCYCERTSTCSRRRYSRWWNVMRITYRRPAPAPVRRPAPSNGQKQWGKSNMRLRQKGQSMQNGKTTEKFSLKKLITGCFKMVWDGIKCGWNWIVNAAKCGWEVVKKVVRFVGNALKCGWDSLTKWVCAKRVWGVCIFGYPRIFSKKPKSCSKLTSVRQPKRCKQAKKCEIRSSGCTNQLKALGAAAARFFEGILPKALVRIIKLIGKVIKVVISAIWNIIKALFNWVKTMATMGRYVGTARAGANSVNGCRKRHGLKDFNRETKKCGDTDGRDCREPKGAKATSQCSNKAAVMEYDRLIAEEVKNYDVSTRRRLGWEGKNLAFIFSLTAGYNVIIGRSFSFDFFFPLKGSNRGRFHASGTVCVSIKTDISVGAGIEVGIFRQASDIPGKALTIAIGGDIPKTECGADLFVTFNVPQFEFIGVGFAAGCGVGIMPVELEVSLCETTAFNTVKDFVPLSETARRLEASQQEIPAFNVLNNQPVSNVQQSHVQQSQQAEQAQQESGWISKVEAEPVDENKVEVVEPTIVHVERTEPEPITVIDESQIDGQQYGYVDDGDENKSEGVEDASIYENDDEGFEAVKKARGRLAKCRNLYKFIKGRERLIKKRVENFIESFGDGKGKGLLKGDFEGEFNGKFFGKFDQKNDKYEGTFKGAFDGKFSGEEAKGIKVRRKRAACNTAFKKYVECNEKNEDSDDDDEGEEMNRNQCRLATWVSLYCGKFKPLYTWNSWLNQIKKCKFIEMRESLNDLLDDLEKLHAMKKPVNQEQMCGCANEPGVSSKCSTLILKFCHSNKSKSKTIKRACSRIAGPAVRRCINRRCKRAVKLGQFEGKEGFEECTDEQSVQDHCFEKPFRKICSRPNKLKILFNKLLNGKGRRRKLEQFEFEESDEESFDEDNADDYFSAEDFEDEDEENQTFSFDSSLLNNKIVGYGIIGSILSVGAVLVIKKYRGSKQDLSQYSTDI